MKTDVINALKKLEDKYIITDSDLKTIEKSNDELFDSIDPACLKLSGGRSVQLPVEEELLCAYFSNKDNSCALKIRPLGDGEGYFIGIYSKSDTAALAQASGLADDLRFGMRRMKRELAGIGQYFDLALESEKMRLERTDEDTFVREALIRAMSNIVNFHEAMRYLSGIPLNSSDCFISPVVEDMCSLVESRTANENIRITKRIDMTCHIRVGAQRLRMVLANLIVNGLMYNDSEVKECIITVEKLDGCVVIKVEDNGVGFDTKRFGGDLFDKWYDVQIGEGLGLMLAKCFCERYDGRLTLESKPGGPTSVAMSFPDTQYDVTKNFSQLPMYTEEDIDSVQYVLSKYFKGMKLGMGMFLGIEAESEDK